MRTIKFRAWDADAEWMVYSDKEDDSYWWEINPLRVGYLVGEDEPIVKYITEIEQFTGLLDKNGKEIWEGDILKADRWIYYWTVRFEQTKARFNCIVNPQGSQNDFIPVDTVEIIGNIHENTDLLKPWK